MISMRKIQFLPAREQVASALREAILKRELKEGEELTLEGTAAALGVSSMPVREAFQILASDGLIRLRPNKGAIVLGVNEKTIRDHYETRALLESEMAARAAREGTDLTEIEYAYQMSVEAIGEHDYVKYSSGNQAFHMSIWIAGDNEKMKTLLSSLWNGLSMGHKVTEEDYAKISTAEHEQILEALRRHDIQESRKRMYDHIIRSMENILTRFGR